MKAIVDKKSNLARGFADVETPNEHADQLLYSLKEKRAVLVKRRQELIDKRKNEKLTKAQDNIYRSELTGIARSLTAIKAKADKGANIQSLLITRLKSVMPLEMFDQCRVLARQDQQRLLDQISIAVLDEEATHKPQSDQKATGECA